jgi:hypothetical protein
MQTRLNARTAVHAITILALGGLLALGQNAAPPGESERAVTEAEVPAPALEALRHLAGPAILTAFAEEVEHGSVFYEGSWKGPHGPVDALVTAAGDLVEIEESLPSDQVPARVRAEAAKAAGHDATLTFEKKTVILYELHYRIAGKGRELILTPDARRYHEDGGKAMDVADRDEDED